MKLLSHIRQQETKSEKSRNGETEKTCYKGFAKDGNGNTRLKPIAVVESHLDYLRIKKDKITPEEFELLVCFIVDHHTLEIDRRWSPGKGGVYYSHTVIGSGGMRGGIEYLEEEGLCSIMLDLPGEYFESKTIVDQWRLIQGLKSRFKVTATRIDLAVDDYDYSVIPVERMVEACKQGHNFGFKKIGYHSSGYCGDRQDETFNFGSRQSGKFVRVYDHEAECLRFETEFKRGYVKPVFESLANLERPKEMPNKEFELVIQKLIASLAVGAIDFRDRGDRQDKTRAGERDSTRLPFYQKFVDLLQATHYRIKLAKPAKSITKSFDWIKRQCSPTIAMIREGLGAQKFMSWLNKAIKDNRPRIDNTKEVWIKDIQKNPNMYMV